MVTGASPLYERRDIANTGERVRAGEVPAAFALGAVVYLAAVITLGVLLRARYVTPLWPGFSFGNLMHAHSHGAYFGWASLALMSGICRLLPRLTGRALVGASWLQRQLWLTHGATVGAIIAFAAAGYNPVSIAFSAVNVLLWYGFAGLYWRNVRGLPRPWPVPLRYFTAAVAMLLLSSLGTWLVTAVTALRVESPLWRAAGLYLFLNSFADGWLLLGLFGLAAALLPETGRAWTGALAASVERRPANGPESVPESVAGAQIGAWAAPLLPWLLVLTAPAFLAFLVPTGAPPIVSGIGTVARTGLGVLYVLFLRFAAKAFGGRPGAGSNGRLPTLPAARTLWLVAAGFLAVKAALHLVGGVGGLMSLPGAAGDILADPPRQLFVAYLHADLLGMVTCGFLAALYLLFGPAAPEPVGGLAAGWGVVGPGAGGAALKPDAKGAVLLGAGVAGMAAALAGAGLVEAGLWPAAPGPALVGLFRAALFFGAVSFAGVLATVAPLAKELVQGGARQTAAGRPRGDR